MYEDISSKELLIAKERINDGFKEIMWYCNIWFDELSNTSSISFQDIEYVVNKQKQFNDSEIMTILQILLNKKPSIKRYLCCNDISFDDFKIMSTLKAFNTDLYLKIYGGEK